jgi:uncharacterized membrane protein (DUF2068 family)
LAVAICGICVPAEAVEIAREVTWTKMLLLIVNVCIVAYLTFSLEN